VPIEQIGLLILSRTSPYLKHVQRVNLHNHALTMLSQLFKCLNHLGLCQSICATRRHIDVVVGEADSKLKQWRQQAESEMSQVQLH